MQLIKILKTGIFFDLDKIGHNFTDYDLEIIATNYNFHNKIAPVVIGHPSNDKPSLGRVTKLLAYEENLYAELDALSPILVNAVNAGEYKYVSPSFFSKFDQENPTKGFLYLKHIGFLGAASPAIKGMGGVTFDNQSVDSFSLPGGFGINASRLKEHLRISTYMNVLGVSYASALKIVASLNR
jgi:hypothetical protein